MADRTTHVSLSLRRLVGQERVKVELQAQNKVREWVFETADAAPKVESAGYFPASWRAQAGDVLYVIYATGQATYLVTED